MPPNCRKSCLGLLLAVSLWPTALLGQAPPTPSSGDINALAGADPVLLSAVVEKLSPQSQKALAEMLSADWKERPEWAEMLISLLKREPLRFGAGWFKPSEMKYGWSWLASTFDANKDGFVAREELPKELPYPELLLARLDRNDDGQLSPEDFGPSGRQQPSPPQMMSRFLTALLDTDSNGRVTPEELQNWLAKADKEKTGFVTSEDMLTDFTRAFAGLVGGGEDMPGPDRMLSLFFRGELGVWGTGPKLGEEAPDFTLPSPGGSQTMTLSKSRGKPVILVFGSFT